MIAVLATVCSSIKTDRYGDGNGSYSVGLEGEPTTALLPFLHASSFLPGEKNATLDLQMPSCDHRQP